MREYGEIVRPYLGVRYVAVTEQLAEASGVSVDYGVLVVSGETSDQVAVMPGSPAEKAGIAEGLSYYRLMALSCEILNWRLSYEVKRWVKRFSC